MSKLKTIKINDTVQYTVNGRIGKCLGPIYHFSVWWIKIEWNDGGTALVLEDYLEVVK